tara:strand:- start:4293 stop:4649 length:357 start_codon:yes stop_codon:yes gene_type:complete
MSAGKAIAQAGHAYVGALRNCKTLDPQNYQSYTSLDVATKICLNGGSEARLISTYQRLQDLRIPSFLVFDSGHVELPDFDGSATLTALGVGPITRSQAPGFLKKFKLWTGLPGSGGVS